MKNLILISHGNSEYTPEIGETELSQHGVKQIMVMCRKFKYLINKYDNAMWFGTTYVAKQIAKFISQELQATHYMREFKEKLLDSSDNIKELSKTITASPCDTNIVIADKRVVESLLSELGFEVEVPEGRIVYLTYNYGPGEYLFHKIID